MNFRIVSTNPYLDTEEEFGDLEADDAASRWDDLTGCGPELATEIVAQVADREYPYAEFVDADTGREVVLRKEIA